VLSVIQSSFMHPEVAAALKSRFMPDSTAWIFRALGLSRFSAVEGPGAQEVFLRPDFR
jgi:hypothetical protein